MNYFSCIAVIVFATGSIFYESIWYDVVYDDHEIWGRAKAAELQFVNEGISYESIKASIHSTYGNIWQPIAWISHCIDTSLFGAGNIAAFKATNLGIHLLNTVLIFALFVKWFKSHHLALCIALLWSLHPLRVESVVWLIERKDVLSCFFFLLAIWMFISWKGVNRENRNRRVIYIVATLICYLLAMGTKVSTVVLPGVLLIINYCLYAKNPSRKDILLFPYIIPFAALAFTCVGVSLSMIESVDFPLSMRLQNVAHNLLRYPLKIIWPEGLSYFYPHRLSVSPMLCGTGVLVFLISLMAAWKWKKEDKLVLLAVLWFWGVTLPLIGIIQVGEQSMADRYLYISSIGLGFLVVFFWRSFVRKNRETYFIIGGAIVCCVFGWQSYQYSKMWKNNTALYQNALKSNSRNYHALYGLAYEHFLAEEFDASRALLTTALEQPFGLADASLLLVKVEEREGSNLRVEKALRIACQHNPENLEIQRRLAWFLFDQQRVNEAALWLLKIATANPQSYETQRDCAFFLSKSGKINQAKERLKVAKSLKKGEASLVQIEAMILGSDN